MITHLHQRLRNELCGAGSLFVDSKHKLSKLGENFVITSEKLDLYLDLLLTDYPPIHFIIYILHWIYKLLYRRKKTGTGKEEGAPHRDKNSII